MTGSSLILQIVEIELDEGTWDGEVSQEQSYHFAVSGKAFAVIIEYFPQLVKKVQYSLSVTWSTLALNMCKAV